MIFYFSATGNSLQAASEIADNTSDYIIDMSEAIKSRNMSYRVGQNEKIGFVFPTFYSGIPTVVVDFIRNVNITADDDCYIYGVLTCGASATGADVMFKRLMNEEGLHVDYCFSLKMPDNYIVIYNPSDEVASAKTLKGAKSDILDASEDIINMKKGGFNSGFKGSIACGIMQPLYNMMRKTKKFYADDKCISCGKCVERCPSSAIKMKDGKPVWIKQKCSHCTACINRCPVKAIQYGSATKTRNRYENPFIK